MGFAITAEDRLQVENNDLFAVLGYFAGLGGWTDDQVTSAREAMSLTYEVLRRQAEADAMNRSLAMPEIEKTSKSCGVSPLAPAITIFALLINCKLLKSTLFK